MIRAIRVAAELLELPAELRLPDPWPEEVAGGRLFAGLPEWTRRCPRPLAPFFDEIDAQLDEYLKRLDLDHGTLVIFDRRPDTPPLPERVGFVPDQTPSGRSVTVLRA